MRSADSLTIPLVAAAGKKVIGHIAFSPVTVSDGTPGWYGLGPVFVLPEHQRRGIGNSLVLDGLAKLESLGANGCVLVNDPGYHERFGFKNLPGLRHEGVPQEVFLALPIGESKPQGTVAFHEGFLAQGGKRKRTDKLIQMNSRWR